MNTETEELKKLMLKKARIQSVVLGLATVIAVLFMIFGFTQRIEAQRQSDMRDEMEFTSKQEISTLKEQLAQCQSEKK